MYLARDTAHRSFVRTFGFTLVEVLVATALLGLLAGSAIWTLTQANSNAAIGRLRTGAENAAQSQIDLFLTESPFNPQSGEIPPVCTLSPPDLVETVTIYSEPNGVSGQTHAVTATRTTHVVKTSGVPLVSSTDLNLYSATVTVTFTYRNKNYSVELNAMRASDV